MKDTLVTVDHVSKKFARSLNKSLWYGLNDLAAELTGMRVHHDNLRKDEFWAVRQVSFDLKRGECLGLIGYNGAGKSTLLKMLNGLIKPDTGSIEIKGRVGALIELGAGFNPVLTGRENIYVNGQILGFSKKEIDQKLHDIIEFSEIGEFIDTPVRNYSSGMKIRLGFSIAAQMEPDVLLIDEVLAVGDLGFRMKCLSRIGALLNNAAVIFVSHSMSQVSRISTKILHLDRGLVVSYSEQVAESLQIYFNSIDTTDSITSGDGTIELNSIRVVGSDCQADSNENKYTIRQRTDITIIVKLVLKVPIERFTVNFGFIDKEAKVVANIFSMYDTVPFSGFGEIELKASTKELGLIQGNYNLSIAIDGLNDKGKRSAIHYYHSKVSVINVSGIASTFAPVVFNGQWEILSVES